MEPVRFALCSDLHHDLMPDAPRRLEEFIACAKNEQVDFIMHLGDFCYANPQNQAFRSLWQQFEGPRYQALGNHDMDHNTKQQAVEFLQLPGAYYSFDAGDLHCVVLDPNHLMLQGQCVDYGFGNYFAHRDKINWLSPQQLEWLERDLYATNKKTLVFSHQSLADPVFGAKNASELQAIFGRAAAHWGDQKVIACLNGHDHTDGVRFLDGVYYVSVNSASFFYMSPEICVPRYSQAITDRYPILREAAPYEEALYTFVTVSEKAITFTGKSTRFVGPSPLECGHCGHAGGHPSTPEIQPKTLWLAP